jgi:hypothetical protein
MYHTATLRQLISEAFSDEEFALFCYDYFRPVWKNFTEGQSQLQRIQELIAFAERYGQLDYLVGQVRKANEVQYGRFRDSLLPGASPSPRTPADELDALKVRLSVAKDILVLLERQKQRYSEPYVPTNVLAEIEKRTHEIAELEQTIQAMEATQQPGNV